MLLGWGVDEALIDPRDAGAVKGELFTVYGLLRRVRCNGNANKIENLASW
jgi:hypothetical protein